MIAAFVQHGKINEPQRCYQHRSAALTTPRYKEHGMAESQPILAHAAPQDSIEYRPIAGFPSYRAGSDGSIWSFKRGEWTPLAQSNARGGYKKVALQRNSRGHTRIVHVIILETFQGPCPEGMEARHFPDGNPANNANSNLRWGTPLENAADRIAHGNQTHGENHNTAKLTESDVREIKSLLGAGVSQQRIADSFGVNQTTVSCIARGKIWRHENA